MSKHTDGGPAYPRQHAIADANDPTFKQGHHGMSMWEYYAGQAMAGILANNDVDFSHGACAEFCADAADAIIAIKREREGAK